LDAGGIMVDLLNFDFDIKFSVVSFVLSTATPDSNKGIGEISKSNKFTNQQIDLIKSLVKNQKIMFEDIIVVGPDGMQRKLNPIVFTTNE